MENSIINGAYDLHVHSAPDVLPRKMDDIEMAQRIIDSGMAGYAIKSHYFGTAERAQLINKMFPGCHALGTMWLNNTVGGINPMAVDIAGRAGTKIIGFPTVDTEYSITRTFQMAPEKRGFWASIIVELKNEGMELKPINILQEGKLLPEVYEVLDLIAKYNMILATGHITREETYALIQAAHERKVERIIATHVSSPGNFTEIDKQKELLQYGAYMEHCTNGVTSGKIEYDVMLAQIKAIGPDRVILSTDLGQPNHKYPDEGLLDFCNRLVESGLSENDVRKTIVDNPVALIQ